MGVACDMRDDKAADTGVMVGFHVAWDPVGRGEFWLRTRLNSSRAFGFGPDS